METIYISVNKYPLSREKLDSSMIGEIASSFRFAVPK
jgi:hypothetical protein